MAAKKTMETTPAQSGQLKRIPVVDRLIDIGKWLLTPPPEPQRLAQISDDSVDWYAGISVDAHHFSSQLQKLQESLHQSCRPIPANPVRSAGISVRAS